MERNTPLNYLQSTTENSFHNQQLSGKTEQTNSTEPAATSANRIAQIMAKMIFSHNDKLASDKDLIAFDPDKGFDLSY